MNNLLCASNRRGIGLVLAQVFAFATLAPIRAAEPANLPKPAAPRTVRVIEYIKLPPLFSKTAGTLDPEDVARVSLNGWLEKRGIPWGSLPDGRPTVRLSFDCRALPWPSIKQHSVDGPDNNMRSLAALSALHDMLPKELEASGAEPGLVGYLLSCTDPGLGLPYSPDSLPRGCAVGHGEFVKDLILMRRYGADEFYEQWARKALVSLRRAANSDSRKDVGQVAYYPVGTITPNEEPPRGPDTTLGGWQHLAVGWNCWAFAQWHAQTNDREALDLAAALANRLTHSIDAEGNDGSLRTDGSFGGTSKENIASCHMHGHTHGLPGLILTGQELYRAGRREEGARYIEQARRTFEWLYDPQQNPDAGSVTGWLGEWLVIRPKTERQTDCEGCTMGDVVETATALGATAELDESFRGNSRYYDRAEEIFRGQCIEQMFTLRKEYRDVLKHCLRERMKKANAEATNTTSAAENGKTTAENTESVNETQLQTTYDDAIRTAERMVGQQLGICGFGDWVNKLPSDLDSALPGIHMQGCCADATVRAAHAIWRATITGDANSARVNMLFNRRTPLLEVVSSLPHRGEVNVIVGNAQRVSIRVPAWAEKKNLQVFVDRTEVQTQYDADYVVFDSVKPGQQLTMTFPLRVVEVIETPAGLDGTTYKERWRGPAIVDIAPRGKWIPTFCRPELESADLPDGAEGKTAATQGPVEK